MNTTQAAEFVKSHTTTQVCDKCAELLAAGDLASYRILSTAESKRTHPRMGRRTRAF